MCVVIRGVRGLSIGLRKTTAMVSITAVTAVVSSQAATVPEV